MRVPAPSDPRDGSPGTWSRATRLLLLLAAVALVATFLDYGITWDERVQSTYGELVLDYFASGGADSRCNNYLDLRYYGPLFETAVAAAYRGFPSWKFEIRHAAVAASAWLTLLAVARFGRSLRPAALPFLAVLSLALLPRFVGHAANNSKDMPFACGFAWGMVGVARLLAAREWTWADALLCGAAIGVALAVRVGALLLLAFLAAGLLLSAMLQHEQRQAWRSGWLDRGTKLLALACVAWLVMVAAWPWAHGAPLLRPLLAFQEMSDFRHGYTTLFDGRLWASADLPRYYLPKYVALTTPLALLALAAVGCAALIADLRRRPCASESVRALLVLLWLFFPLTYAVIFRPNVYDGIRHFLFVLPALALLAASGAASVLEWAGRKRSWALLSLLVALGLPLKDIAGLHPYQSSYFNAFAGGTRGAWGRYEMDYWASSYREAMRWIIEDAWSRPGLETAIVVACNENNRPCAEHYLETRIESWRPAGTPALTPPPRISMTCVWRRGDEARPRDADYYVATLRFGKADAFFADWPVVHRVGRCGATFALIRRNPLATRPPA